MPAKKKEEPEPDPEPEEPEEELFQLWQAQDYEGDWSPKGNAEGKGFRFNASHVGNCLIRVFFT